MVSCWAEGILRGGAGGLWGGPPTGLGGATGVLAGGFGEAGSLRGAPASGWASTSDDPWGKLRALSAHMYDNPYGIPTAAGLRLLNQLRAQAAADWRRTHGNAPMPPMPGLPPLPGLLPGGMGAGPAFVQGAISPPQIVYPGP